MFLLQSTQIIASLQETPNCINWISQQPPPEVSFGMTVQLTVFRAPGAERALIGLHLLF